jgi:hypothetical protein
MSPTFMEERNTIVMKRLKEMGITYSLIQQRVKETTP